MKKKRTAEKLDQKVAQVPVGKPGAVQGLVGELRTIILQARQQALRAVDVIQVRTCWLVGRHLVEFEQDGASRAAYGRGLLAAISAQLTSEFGKGFDASNLRYMRLFYQVFPNCDALRHELSWTHYRHLLRVDDAATRTWYMDEAAGQNWNTRALERQIGTLYYERLLASKDRQPVSEEAACKLAAIPRAVDADFEKAVKELKKLPRPCKPKGGQS